MGYESGVIRAHTIVLVLAAALAGCSATARGACEQQKACLDGHDRCEACATENFVEVCEADHQVNLVAFSSCEDADCEAAASAYLAYLECTAQLPCELWLKSVDPMEQLTLCETELNVYRDARNVCRDDKRNSCVL